MKSSLRAFGIGLFVAGAALGIVNATTKEQPTQQTMSKQTTDKDAAGAGQLKALQQQNNALEQENEALEQRINKLKKKLKQQQTTEAKPTTQSAPTYALHIASGMGTTEITDTLKKAGIISNAREFEQYIIDEGQATKLQNGSFFLNKNMSYEEILRVLIE